jgi:hypothetical protein
MSPALADGAVQHLDLQDKMNLGSERKVHENALCGLAIGCVVLLLCCPCGRRCHHMGGADHARFLFGSRCNADMPMSRRRSELQQFALQL